MTEDGTLPNNEYERIGGQMTFDFLPRRDLRVEGGLGVTQGADAVAAERQQHLRLSWRRPAGIADIARHGATTAGTPANRSVNAIKPQSRT
jgi:hypothetical protein